MDKPRGFHSTKLIPPHITSRRVGFEGEKVEKGGHPPLRNRERINQQVLGREKGEGGIAQRVQKKNCLPAIIERAKKETMKKKKLGVKNKKNKKKKKTQNMKKRVPKVKPVKQKGIALAGGGEGGNASRKRIVNFQRSRVKGEKVGKSKKINKGEATCQKNKGGDERRGVVGRQRANISPLNDTTRKKNDVRQRSGEHFL